jgi:excisionase family DNA binding protein
VSSNVIPLTGRTPRDRPAQHAEQTNDTPAPVVSIGSCAVYTVAEVAHMLSLSRGSTYNLIRSGDIPALKLGGRWVIPKRRFHTWLDNLPTASVEDLDHEMNRHPDRIS